MAILAGGRWGGRMGGVVLLMRRWLGEGSERWHRQPARAWGAADAEATGLVRCQVLALLGVPAADYVAGRGDVLRCAWAPLPTELPERPRPVAGEPLNRVRTPRLVSLSLLLAAAINAGRLPARAFHPACAILPFFGQLEHPRRPARLESPTSGLLWNMRSAVSLGPDRPRFQI